ncbi:MAG: hypothetical protein IPL59_04650 [Candidatus Competibacteraceae bacterium]|nr:hypothetical protein [Candidatus Competibacteraceae bacterium]
MTTGNRTGRHTLCTHSLCNAHHLRELRYCQVDRAFLALRSPPPSRGRPEAVTAARAAGQPLRNRGTWRICWLFATSG